MMKYLKNYRIFESFDIEDLSDYFQEVFDKFSIRKRSEGGDSGINNPIEWYTYDDLVCIDLIPLDDVSKIRSELKRVLPTVEKRIGIKLIISNGQNRLYSNRYWISILPFVYHGEYLKN